MCGVSFDLWTLCGVLCGVICKCGVTLCGTLCVGALCGVIPLLAVWGVFLRREVVPVFFCVCGVVWGRVCECLRIFCVGYFACVGWFYGVCVVWGPACGGIFLEYPIWYLGAGGRFSLWGLMFFISLRLFLIFFLLIYFKITFIPLFYPYIDTVYVIGGGVRKQPTQKFATKILQTICCHGPKT